MAVDGLPLVQEFETVPAVELHGPDILRGDFEKQRIDAQFFADAFTAATSPSATPEPRAAGSTHMAISS